jgi:hypothetical protein
MEASCPETSVYFQRITRRYMPEDNTLHNHRCENHESLILDHNCSFYTKSKCLVVSVKDLIKINRNKFLFIHVNSSYVSALISLSSKKWKDSSTGLPSIVHSRRRESHRKQMHVVSPSLLE